MRIDNLFKTIKPTMSLEFFPPKTERATHTLDDTLSQLSGIGADFISITDGAGGTTREKTQEIVLKTKEKHNLLPMAHLTSADTSKDEIKDRLDIYAENGIENILALRGDPVVGQDSFVPHENGYKYATELIDDLMIDGRFCVFASAYPEGHPEAKSKEADWDILKMKFDKGASAAITQCFFSTDSFLEMRDYVGSDKIIPGILPVTDYYAIKRFCDRCGANMSKEFIELFEPIADDKIACRKAGIKFTIEFCEKLIKEGVIGLHLFALNRSTAVAEIITALRMKELI